MAVVSILVIFAIGTNIIPMAYAETYHNDEQGFSVNYPIGWQFDDLTLGDDILVTFVYVDETLRVKADIDRLYEKNLDYEGYVQDYIHSMIFFRDVTKSVNPIHHSSNEHVEKNSDYLEILFNEQAKDCQLLKLDWEIMDCRDRKLIDKEIVSMNNKNAYKIEYSWIEKNEVCDYYLESEYAGDVIRCRYEDYKNTSTVLEFENDGKIWRINSKIRTEQIDSLSSQMNEIIDSLRLFEKTESKIMVPEWIKNNARWWIEGKLNDNTFKNGIKFLIENHLIRINPDISESNDVGRIGIEQKIFQLENYRGGTTPVKIFGNIEDFHESYRIEIIITKPDKQVDSIRVIPGEEGFEFTYLLKHDFPQGQYYVTGIYERGNKELATIEFLVQENIVEEQEIPEWIKNNARWWIEGKLNDKMFLQGIEYLVNNQIIVIESGEQESNPKFKQDVDVISSSRVVPDIDYFEVMLIYASQENDCSPEERRNAAEYGFMAEYLLEKNLRKIPARVDTICMQLSEIKENHYPLVLAKLSANKPNMLIFVGDIKANFESYYDLGAYGWWAVIPTYSSKLTEAYEDIQMIVICECDKRYENQKEGAMWTLSHEIAHYNLYEQEFNRSVFVDNIHWVEHLYRECIENDTLETEECKKLYETVDVLGVNYRVMDIIFLKTDWKEIQNSVSQEVLSK